MKIIIANKKQCISFKGKKNCQIVGLDSLYILFTDNPINKRLLTINNIFLAIA